MINWLGLLANSIWILALALALAAISIVYWKSQHSGEKMREFLRFPEFAFPLRLAVTVFCIGMVASSSSWWKIILWGIFAVLFGWQSVEIFKDWRKKPDTEDHQGNAGNF